MRKEDPAKLGSEQGGNNQPWLRVSGILLFEEERLFY